jgi:methanethiol S-methyltransferase
VNAGFFWILLAVGLYGLVHSILASLTAKALAERWLGMGIRRYYRFLFSILGAVTFLPVTALLAFFPSTVLYRIAMPWLALTIAGQILGVAIAGAGVLQVKALVFMGVTQLFTAPEKSADNPLVVRGVYHWVRHPLYLGGLLVIWLVPTMTWNLLALNLGVTAYLLIGIWFEERKLLAEFGPAYTEYKQKTPALIPRLSLGKRR